MHKQYVRVKVILNNFLFKKTNSNFLEIFCMLLLPVTRYSLKSCSNIKTFTCKNETRVYCIMVAKFFITTQMDVHESVVIKNIDV